jgi:hypothetical protein
VNIYLPFGSAAAFGLASFGLRQEQPQPFYAPLFVAPNTGHSLMEAPVALPWIYLARPFSETAEIFRKLWMVGSDPVNSSRSLLPAPRPGAQQGSLLAKTIEETGTIVSHLLRQVLASITSSLTALGNSANLHFSQISAALAFNRMTRQTIAFFGVTAPFFAFAAPPAVQKSWPLLASYAAPSQQPAAFMAGWFAAAESFAFWTKLWPPSPVWPPQSRSF